MLLPNMTYDEIRRLLFLELDDITRRTEKQFSTIARDVRKRKLKNKKMVYFKKFTTKNKTRWLVRIEKYKGNKYKVTSFYGSFFRDTKGFRYVEINKEKESLEIYNAHFLRRYVERMQLDFTDPLEIMKVFFITNTGISVPYYSEEIDDNVFKTYSQVPEGIKLGTHDYNRKVLIWNTFISANEYIGNQKILKQRMKEILDKEKEDEPNKIRTDCQKEYLKRLLESM